MVLLFLVRIEDILDLLNRHIPNPEDAFRDLDRIAVNTMFNNGMSSEAVTALKNNGFLCFSSDIVFETDELNKIVRLSVSLAGKEKV